MDKNAEYLSIGNPDTGLQNRILKDSVAKSLKCHRIGRITGFDSTTFLCKVQLLDKMTYLGQEESFVEIPSLPLVINGTKTSHITLGDIVGSECIVHFNDVDFDNWLETGESYTPVSRRKHDFADGFVELRPFNKTAVFSYYTSGLEIKNGNSLIHLNDNGTIEITNGSATISMSGSTIAITGDLTVTGDVTAGTVSLKTHVHSGVQSGSSNTGTPV